MVEIGIWQPQPSGKHLYWNSIRSWFLTAREGATWGVSAKECYRDWDCALRFWAEFKEAGFCFHWMALRSEGNSIIEYLNCLESGKNQTSLKC